MKQKSDTENKKLKNKRMWLWWEKMPSDKVVHNLTGVYKANICKES